MMTALIKADHSLGIGKCKFSTCNALYLNWDLMTHAYISMGTVYCTVVMGTFIEQLFLSVIFDSVCEKNHWYLNWVWHFPWELTLARDSSCNVLLFSNPVEALILLSKDILLWLLYLTTQYNLWIVQKETELYCVCLFWQIIVICSAYLHFT